MADVENPVVSICVPAYKRPQNIRRLLQSIREQSFKDFEVIISDDSPDDSVKGIMGEYSDIKINYYKNSTPLGTPANWNYAITKAKGEWIKIMHDDDWFAEDNSLMKYVEAAKNSGESFLFSGYYNIFENGNNQRKTFFNPWSAKIVQNPVLLLARNIIGPPSVTLVHHSIKEKYDERMKWRVDIDYYIRLILQRKSFHAINEPLVNVGIGSDQVTNDCIDVPDVELPEGYLLIHKYGISRLRTLLVYDAWWRIIRNVKIRSVQQLNGYSWYGPWPDAILTMVRHQGSVPYGLLKLGVFSKVLMFLSYLVNFKRLKDH